MDTISRLRAYISKSQHRPGIYAEPIMPALRCLDMRRFASSVTVGSYMLVTEGECPAHAVVCQPRISAGTSQRM